MTASQTRDPKNLPELLQRPHFDRPALCAPGLRPLHYGELNRQVEYVGRVMRAANISKTDTVALLLPNGPQMATAFLGIASFAICAPLNPGYGVSELEFYLSDLNASAVVVLAGSDSPVRDIARRLGVTVLEVLPSTTIAGGFVFAMKERTPEGSAEYGSADDVCLILHTSGTTSRPKIVPLTQQNLCASALAVARVLALTSEDVGLNVMPLFHIHGLVGVLLSTLAAGGSIVCTAGYDSAEFPGLLGQCKPTWYSAVPTIHQSVLEAVGNKLESNGHTLRLIRSSSSALPPVVMANLEETFGVPVIEAYGMTEAAHQMASNPLPPGMRKPGSVGIAAGPEIAIMDETGELMAPEQVGEIVIRGVNVTAGYGDNPEANLSAFTNGWFRTGDLGRFDSDGYLFITGRIKEIVNRGGEKISPREVDEALLQCPGVRQAVAFAVPHPTLGEDLAAAVVLQEGCTSSEEELRQFAFSMLSDFKVPSQIVIVDEIPKGATGKVQRLGLAEKLQSELLREYAAPARLIEKSMVDIWERILNRQHIGIRDNFFALGGDSLLAASVVRECEKLLGKKIEPSVLFQSPTIEQISNRLLDGKSKSASWLVPIRQGGSRNPLFLVPGHGGDIFTYVLLSRYLDQQRPVYVFRFPEAARLDDETANRTLKDMATLYVNELTAFQPTGAFDLGGFCFGGELAFEIAQQLHQRGRKTGVVAIIHVNLPGTYVVRGWGKRIASQVRKITSGTFRDKIQNLKSLAVTIVERSSRYVVPSVSRRFVPRPAYQSYFPLYFHGAIHLFHTRPDSLDLDHDPYMGWKGLADRIELFSLPGDRYTTFTEPHVQLLAEHLNYCLDNSAARSTRSQ